MKLRKCIALLLLVVMVLALAPSVTYATPPLGPCPSPYSSRNGGNHNWRHTGHKDPTCTEAGSDTYRCGYCDQLYTDTIPPLGHDWSGPQVVKAPTCFDAGLNHYVCRRNSSHQYDEVVPALGHNWGPPQVVKAPTCTEDGLTRYVCQRNDNHTRDFTAPALGHDWSDWYVAKEPSLLEEGIEERVCQRCGLTEQRAIPMLGQKEDYSLTLIMTQAVPAGDTFAYDDVFGEGSGVALLYNVTLINTGKGPMNVRDFVGGNGVSSTIDTQVLEPGQSASFSLPWTLTDEDIIPGSASETLAGAAHFDFFFFGDDFDGDQVCCSNTVSFEYKVKNPEGFEDWDMPSESTVEVWKELLYGPSDPNGWQLDETLVFVIYVRNIGDLDIEGLTICDVMDGYPEEALITVNLPVDEVRAYTLLHTVTPEDVNKGYISNFGRARWADPEDGESMLCDSYDVTVPVINRAGMVVTKAVDGGPANGKYYVPGETVHFKVTVHNNTGVTQKAIMVVDPLVGETKTCPDLNPGESVTLDFDYVVTEYDAIVGYVENYAYTMEIDGFSNTVWVDTGFDDPFGVITALEVIKEETSTPKDPRGYQLGETISYTITVKNIGETMIVEGTVHDSLASGSGEIGAFDNLYPDTSRTYKFSYKVTESDIVNHQVVNQAFAWLDGDVIPSEPVKSPTWSDEITEEEKKDTSGAFLPGDDFCKRELTGKGPATDAFSVHFCAEHLKVAEELEALKATASEEEYLKAARAAYLQAMDDMYEAAADKADSAAAAALMEQRLTFKAYMSTYEALLNSLYPSEPLTVARELEREARERCVDLCYDLHEAGKARPDSILGTYEALAAATSVEVCARTEGERQEAELAYTEVLCAAHAAIDEKVAALTGSAQNGEARTNAFLRAQRMWQTAMDTRTNAHYKAADKDGRALIVKNRKALDKYLAARKGLLTVLYPDQPDVVAQVVARVIQDKEMDLCKLWK